MVMGEFWEGTHAHISWLEVKAGCLVGSKTPGARINLWGGSCVKVTFSLPLHLRVREGYALMTRGPRAYLESPTDFMTEICPVFFTILSV